MATTQVRDAVGKVVLVIEKDDIKLPDSGVVVDGLRSTVTPGQSGANMCE